MNKIAEKALERWADEPTNRLVRKALDENIAHWEDDPHEEGVVGLVHNTTRTALVVVYLEEEDFEVGDNVEMCVEFDEFGTCIHEDHMIQKGM